PTVAGVQTALSIYRGVGWAGHGVGGAGAGAFRGVARESVVWGSGEPVCGGVRRRAAGVRAPVPRPRRLSRQPLPSTSGTPRAAAGHRAPLPTFDRAKVD